MDWPGLMRFGLGVLRLSPDAFWALTPAELMLMSGHTPGAVPMGQARLAQILAEFPDVPQEVTNDRL